MVSATPAVLPPPTRRKFAPPGVIAIGALLFVVQNTESVPFNLLWFEFTARCG